MNFGDWSGWIALVLAIVSPIFTSLYDGNRIKREQRNADIQNANLKKMEILDDYLEKTAQLILNSNSKNCLELKSLYCAAHFKTAAYVSPETLQAMETLFNSLIFSSEIDSKSAFNNLTIISTLFLLHDQPVNQTSSLDNSNNSRFSRELKKNRKVKRK